jgi:UDP-N-acetylmuramoyl-L-alanyl-D-glutamate--2,6-diaminopimelate ligase
MAAVSDRTWSVALQGVRFSELIQAANADVVRGDSQLNITSVQYDSRKIEPGDLFVALRGGYADGHHYLQDALRRGATAALVEDESNAAGYHAVAVTTNTRQSLSPLSARFFRYPAEDLGVIGITGTDGKTTTSYLVDAMLRANGFVTGLVGTVAVRVGERLVLHDTRQTTPESLEIQRLLAEMRDESVDWAVLEATSHALALYRLNDVPFDIGVVTNVTREHLDFHGSVEAYRAAKAQLIRRVESRTDRERPRAAVMNLDDEGAREIGLTSSVPVTWFSTLDPGASMFADEVRVHAAGTTFRLKAGNAAVPIDLKLIGGYNVFNAMAAAGVGFALGLNLDAVKDGLESLEHVPGRMQRITCGQPFSVIVDYAHSPASLEETLNLLRAVTPGRLIVVTGSAGERDRGKRPLQGRISAKLSDFAIFTSEDPRFEDPDTIVREIAEGAESSGAQQGVDFCEIENRREAIQAAIDYAEPGDAILLAGKGHETCMIYDDEQIPWNEAGEAIEALRRSGFAEAPDTAG